MALSSQVTSKKNVTIFYLAIHLLNSLIRTKEPKYKKIGKKKNKKRHWVNINQIAVRIKVSPGVHLETNFP